MNGKRFLKVQTSKFARIFGDFQWNTQKCLKPKKASGMIIKRPCWIVKFWCIKIWGIKWTMELFIFQCKISIKNIYSLKYVYQFHFHTGMYLNCCAGLGMEEIILNMNANLYKVNDCHIGSLRYQFRRFYLKVLVK